MPMPEPSTCSTCGGGGYLGSDICDSCIGTGSLPLRGLHLYLKTVLDDMSDKVDAITVDLTALEAWCTTVNQKLAYLKEKIDAL